MNVEKLAVKYPNDFRQTLKQDANGTWTPSLGFDKFITETVTCARCFSSCAAMKTDGLLTAMLEGGGWAVIPIMLNGTENTEDIFCPQCVEKMKDSPRPVPVTITGTIFDKKTL